VRLTADVLRDVKLTAEMADAAPSPPPPAGGPLLTEAGQPLTTEDNQPIQVES
jgi:hypothetical protein